MEAVVNVFSLHTSCWDHKAKLYGSSYWDYAVNSNSVVHAAFLRFNNQNISITRFIAVLSIKSSLLIFILFYQSCSNSLKLFSDRDNNEQDE